MSQRINIKLENYTKVVTQVLVDKLKSSSQGVIVLGGGNSPKAINKELHEHFQNDPKFEQHFFSNFTTILSDERYVSQQDALSNYKMLKETLYNNNANKLIGFDTCLPLRECIEKSNSLIEDLLASNNLVFSLLGIGADGHTASLFPGHDINNDKFVAYGGKGPEGADRISLTHKLLLQSEDIYFLVNSEQKRSALENSNQDNVVQYPLKPFIDSEKSKFLISE